MSETQKETLPLSLGRRLSPVRIRTVVRRKIKVNCELLAALALYVSCALCIALGCSMAMFFTGCDADNNDSPRIRNEAKAIASWTKSDLERLKADTAASLTSDE